MRITGERPLREIGKAIGAMVALSFAISVFLLVMYGGERPLGGLYGLAASILVGMTYGLSIGLLAWGAMLVLARPLWQLHPVLRWAILILLFAVVGMAGSLLATAIVKYVYPFQWSRPLLDIWLGSLRTSMSITIPMGVIFTVIESHRERLRHTEVQLRTKELERERAIKLATEAQLAALSARVEPHFLFNTLNTISSLIREDPARAERTIEQLSSLLRSSLDSTNTTTIPLEQELKLVASYLEIQATRFGGRLRFTLPPVPEREGVLVPPFSIQTLVENSVKYAVAPSREGASIQVRLQWTEASLVVEIEDDGPGFTPQQIASGHGIDNLQGRLRSLFGAAASLAFVRAPGSMRVRMRVPA
ncbi:MAG: histidine kinase [Acidobacteria bacterium]|nr:histidine kinase [Acidobacteriota bacterium]